MIKEIQQPIEGSMELSKEAKATIFHFKPENFRKDFESDYFAFGLEGDQQPKTSEEANELTQATLLRLRHTEMPQDQKRDNLIIYADYLCKMHSIGHIKKYSFNREKLIGVGGLSIREINNIWCLFKEASHDYDLGLNANDENAIQNITNENFDDPNPKLALEVVLTDNKEVRQEEVSGNEEIELDHSFKRNNKGNWWEILCGSAIRAKENVHESWKDQGIECWSATSTVRLKPYSAIRVWGYDVSEKIIYRKS